MRLSFIALACFGVSSLGCGTAGAELCALELEVVVESDPGQPMSGVPVYVEGEQIGFSGADGLLRSTVVERPGKRVRASCRCPAGHLPAEPSESFLVKRYSARGTIPAMRIDLRCRPSERLAVFVVRAVNGPHVHVLLSGEHVTSTDSNGVAHFSTRASPGTEHRVDLLVDASSSLLPRSHTFFFVTPDADELFVMDPRFERARSKRPQIRRRPRIIRIE